MRWVWDDNADNRIVQLWHLREKLSASGKVVYVKFFQNRATFLSLKIFPSLLRCLNDGYQLPRQAQQLLQLLLEDSPQTTKSLKKTTKREWGWQNKDFEGNLKILWQRLLIVGVGEVDDGAFPSLNIAATEHHFELLWQSSQSMTAEESDKILEKWAPKDSLLRKQVVALSKIKKTKRPTKKTGTIRYQDLVKQP